MPGVPSSRGCESCRKSKKKCDQRQPCSRCIRMELPCEGGGKQRYQFKSVRVIPKVKEQVRWNLNSISQAPCNQLATRFIRTLDISDIRFDISFYGLFLKDIPRRLGESAVLDAAAQALVSSHPLLHPLRNKEVPRDALVLFGKSLRALRECLDNPVEVRSPHTLCAVYLISICQAWLGKYEEQSASHGTAIAHLLRIVDIPRYKSGFERDLIVTLSVPVILDGICNPRVQMAPSFWDNVMALIQEGSATAPDGIPRPTTTLLSLSKFPKYLHHPHAHFPEIAKTYIKLREDAQNIYPYLDQLTEPAGLSSPVLGQRSRHRAAYTVITALALLLNTILRALDSENVMLAQESTFFCERIINEAKLASSYRPLGAAYVVPCLVVALGTAEDPQQRARIEATLTDYQTDFQGFEWRELATWLRAVFQSHRTREPLISRNLEDIFAFEVQGACMTQLQAIFGLCLYSNCNKIKPL
ncbi:hypothetical protein N7463_001112 [Penicillium fimorum]|uniref:Zn(2)-C6 fungal-type domain-containing protein n=1 Tax=Penicillium fimorum TaxID=1882269 RepID=A0A9W9Y5H1_9EURO|nr:hypothetical protein N7463_001112 [Penicillium fimorum]